MGLSLTEPLGRWSAACGRTALRASPVSGRAQRQSHLHIISFYESRLQVEAHAGRFATPSERLSPMHSWARSMKAGQPSIFGPVWPAGEGRLRSALTAPGGGSLLCRSACQTEVAVKCVVSFRRAVLKRSVRSASSPPPPLAGSRPQSVGPIVSTLPCSPLDRAWVDVCARDRNVVLYRRCAPKAHVDAARIGWRQDLGRRRPKSGGRPAIRPGTGAILERSGTAR